MFFTSTQRLDIWKGLEQDISKNVVITHKTYWQKLLKDTKQSAIDAIQTASKIKIQKITEATVDLIGKKIADKLTEV